MDGFDCHGWLYVTITEASDNARIKLTHRLQHVPYCCIDIPSDVREYIEAKADLLPTQVRAQNVIFYIW